MKRYIVVSNFYEGNSLHEIGQEFVHKDNAYIEKCLADGNIEEVNTGEGQGSADADPSAPPEISNEGNQGDGEASNPLGDSPESPEGEQVPVIVNPTPEQITQDIESISPSSTQPS